MDANSTIWTPTAQYGHQQHKMDDNSTIWTPTAHGHQQLISFCGNLPKSCQNGEKFLKKDVKRVKILYICLIDFSNSDSYRTIGSPVYLVQ
jgi:hypothetical protein